MPTNPNTAEPSKPRRRFQFRLRTLMIVVVTLLVIALGYVAYEWQFVHARRAWREAHPFWMIPAFDRLPQNAKQPPWIRRWLGDGTFPIVLIASESERKDAEYLFPEAKISVVPSGR
jgi:hypothetical protein